MADNCEVCNARLRGLLSRVRSLREREDAYRQMNMGACFSCQRQRHEAAMEYERAVTELNLLTYSGIRFPNKFDRMPTGRAGSSLMNHALQRMQTAANRCDQLKMWPDKRLPRESETK